MVNIPKSWQEITLEQYMQLMELGDDIPGNDGLLLKLAALTGSEIEEINKMVASDFQDAISRLDFISTPPSGPPLEMLKGHKMRELSRMTVGEFTDLEMRQKPEFLHLHLSFLYPEDMKYEPDKRFAHAEEFRACKMSEALPALRHYQEWREKMFNDYAGLFSSGEPAEAPKDERPADRKRRLREEEHERRQAERWNWFGFISRLAGNDPMKFESASELNIVFALNFVAYMKENNIT